MDFKALLSYFSIFILLLGFFYNIFSINFSHQLTSTVYAQWEDGQSSGGLGGGNSEGLGKGSEGNWDNYSSSVDNGSSSESIDQSISTNTDTGAQGSIADNFADFVSEVAALGGPGGTGGGSAPDTGWVNGPLSNQNHSVDSGITASYAISPDSLGGTDFQCPGCIPPTLSATTYCSGTQPVINLTWSQAVMGGLRAYYLLKQGTPGAYITWWAYPRIFNDIQVAQQTIYYYAVFGANGDDGTYTSRTAFSNVMAVLTPNCNPPSGPGTFSFTQASTYACLAPSYSTIYVSWTPSANANYYIITPVTNNPEKGVGGVMPAINTGAGTSLLYPIPGAPVPGEAWAFTVTAVNAYGASVVDGSYTSWVAPIDCELPAINLRLNGKQSYDLPLAVKQKDTASLTWSVSHANSCTASPQSTPSDPNITPANLNAINNAFTGVKALTGSASIPTLDIGTYRFTLACTNSNVPAYPASTTSTLIVNQLQKPYIQTTGGDVHTNETIFISQ